MVRDALLSDAPSIARVHVAAWHATYRGLMPDSVMNRITLDERTARWTVNLATTDRARRNTVYEVPAPDGERIVQGFGTFGVSRDEPGTAEVWALYVHPDRWGTGAGRELMRDGLAHLKQRGFDDVMLWVLEGNHRAIRFYRAVGFELDGGKKDDDGLPHLRMRASGRELAARPEQP